MSPKGREEGAPVTTNIATGAGTVGNSPATIQETESTVSEDDIDAPLPGKAALLASPTVTVRSDDDATISGLNLDEGGALLRATAASFASLCAMGFDSKKALLALLAANRDENLAVEYLLSGIPQETTKEVDLGGERNMQDEETTKEDESGDYHVPSQEEREQQVISRLRSQGFNEEEIAEILDVFRQDRMAALDLEFGGPSSARAADNATSTFTIATIPRLHPRATRHLFATPRSLTIRSETLSPDQSTQQADSVPVSRVASLDYISPFTNGYTPTSPPIDPRLTKKSQTNKSLKRPHENSSDTVTPLKNQKKRRRAPTPPRYKGLTRKEYIKRRFEEEEDDDKPWGVLQE